MKFIKDTTWSEVFEGWRVREANNPAWVECATKAKGWPDWESWRSFTAQQLDAANRDWKIFQFENPLVEIPDMLIGPFGGWQSRVERKNQTTFKELLEIPEQYQEWSNHAKILSIMNGLPFVTDLIGLVRTDLGQVVCLEGHHRATAITLAQKQGRIIDFSQIPVTIALTELATEECRLLDQLLQRGTSKNPQT